MSDNNTPKQTEYFLRPGYIYIPGEPTLISTVLGSCVAVSLWDREKQRGGMNHFMYPVVRDPQKATAKYGNASTKALIRHFIQTGSRKAQLEAQIFGGSQRSMDDGVNSDIGAQNIKVARHILTKNGVPIVSQDVGGNKGRKLIYNSMTNEVMIIRVERLRTSDWYPYQGAR